MRHKNAKPITVAELIEALRQEDQDRIIVLSRDPEGNGYSVLRCASVQSYKDGEIGIEKLDAEAKKAGYTAEDVMAGQKALVLWPS